jgi:hypothetical protein
VLVDNHFDIVLSFQARSRRITEWPLCATCLKAQRRARVYCTLVTIALVGFVWFLLVRAATRSTVVEFFLGFVFCALGALAFTLWRRTLMPALSAGLRLSRDCRTLVVKARPSSPSIQAELQDVSASRWY